MMPVSVSTTFALLVFICAERPSVDGFSSKRTNTRRQRQHGQPSGARPIVPPNAFAHQSARLDGIDIMPAPDGKGMGAYATAAVLSETILGEYSGEILTRKEVEARYWDNRKPNKHDRKWRNSRRRRNQGISGDYLFDMGGDLFIDGEDADISTWCRFANHASPSGGGCNVEVRRSSSSPGETAGNDLSKDEPRLYFAALRDIQAGEEICYDYGVEYWDGRG